MKNKKNWAYTGGAVTLALAVAAGTKSGDLVKLGDGGLYGYASTDVATADQVMKGLAPQGLIENQAALFLPGIVMTISVPSTALTGIADFAKVYLAADKSYSAAAAGNTWVGYRLNATTLALRSN
jgi:predicted RecA/RadA family phage recombinase